MTPDPAQLVVVVDQDGHTTLELDAPAPRDECSTFTQDRLFTPPATMAGQLTMEG